MENWHVAQTKFGQEKKAEQQLTSQGVESLLPVFSEVRLKNGAIRRVAEQPLFPNYIFVRFDPEKVHTTAIKATRGIASLISFGGLPAIVPERVIERLKEGWQGAPQNKLMPEDGDRVIIQDGAFEGIEAIWCEPDGMSRAVLLFKILNRQMRVPVESHMRFHIAARAADQPDRKGL
ncbi:transcription/translation regulatory transformer protein RfaH [Pantoea ananatis]|uniref:transcription/translation regulatory transformer protein RfaH n=1 Tax=Pantoea ananas TaxID=553 RepID=UPI001B3173A9|nr:transcription/translation regulatory transformer protein RfaH [Pantoea ananatis]